MLLATKAYPIVEAVETIQLFKFKVPKLVPTKPPAFVAVLAIVPVNATSSNVTVVPD